MRLLCSSRQQWPYSVNSTRMRLLCSSRQWPYSVNSTRMRRLCSSRQWPYSVNYQNETAVFFQAVAILCKQNRNETALLLSSRLPAIRRPGPELRPLRPGDRAHRAGRRGVQRPGAVHHRLRELWPLQSQLWPR